MKKQLSVLFLTLLSSSLLKAQVVMNESFESPAFPPTGWALFNNGTGNDWALNNVDATYASQGTQSAFYLYSDTAAANAWLFTPSQSFSNGDSIVISFDYIVGGANYPESLKLTMGNGQNVAAQTTTLWDQDSLVNESFLSATIGLKITANGSYNFGFNCYSVANQYVLFIDNVKIRKVLTNDLKIHNYNGVLRSCSFSNAEEIAIDFDNIGGVNQSNFPIAYKINNGPVVSEMVSNNVAAGTSFNYVFNAGTDFSVPGTYQMKIFTQLSNDGDRTNDTTYVTIISDPAGQLVKTNSDTINIPDNTPSGIYSDLQFCSIPNSLGSNIKIKRLSIQGINHTYSGDLTLELISPVGDTLLLSSDNGAGFQNYPSLTFSDTALTYITIHNNDSILPGYYHTQDSLGFAKFNGEDPNGFWKLHMIDNAGADIGYLIAWTLEFENTVGIQQFTSTKSLVKVYPNPNNGVFTVESASRETVIVEIYSVSGQLVGSTSVDKYTPKQSINLSEFAKGMYFVKSRTINATQVSKVIVE